LISNSYLFPFITRVHYSIIVSVKFRARAGGGADPLFEKKEINKIKKYAFSNEKESLME